MNTAFTGAERGRSDIDRTPLTLAKLGILLRGHSVWAIAIVLALFFAVQSGHFLTSFNVSNILTQCVFIGLISVGLTPVIISGNIDLSIGATVGLTACLFVALQPYGLELALLGALAAGAAVGLVNGLLVERTGISSFIVTLAMMSGIRGLTFLAIGDTSLSAADDRPNLWAMAAIGPIPVTVGLFAIFAVIVALVLRVTIHGRNTYAIGGNRSAAIDAGIPVSAHIVANFVLCGFMAAICGVTMAANLGAAAPTFGTDYELLAITAVVLGGTRLQGGRGGVAGTIGAVLALTVLRNGLNLMRVSPFYIPLIVGAVLIVALIIDRQFNTRKLEHGE
jgi:ribose transport system permease protein